MKNLDVPLLRVRRSWNSQNQQRTFLVLMIRSHLRLGMNKIKAKRAIRKEKVKIECWGISRATFNMIWMMTARLKSEYLPKRAIIFKITIIKKRTSSTTSKSHSSYKKWWAHFKLITLLTLLPITAYFLNNSTINSGKKLYNSSKLRADCNFMNQVVSSCATVYWTSSVATKITFWA